MKGSYRIVEAPWVGHFSNRVYRGFLVEKRHWIFGWYPCGTGRIFDSFEQAEDYLNKCILKEKVIVKEY